MKGLEKFIEILKKEIKEESDCIMLTILLTTGIMTIITIELEYNKELMEKNEKLEKIIKKEIGKNFETYEEYILYKIEMEKQ